MFQPPSSRNRGFTLVELLVVMVVIGILIAILLPAINATRSAARNNGSKNNVRQIQMAMLNHEASKGFMAPSWQGHRPVSGNSDISGWSVFALLLPYLEQNPVASEIDFEIPYVSAPNVVTADGASTKLSALRVPTYVSPGNPRDEARFSGGVAEHYPIDYAVNVGVWFVYDPADRTGGLGAAYPESRLCAGAFTDGTSSTLGFAEVKSWNPYYRNAAKTHAQLANIPTDADICALGGDFKDSSGHTEWVDGRVHQVGFTTVFRPNQMVACSEGGTQYNVDWTNWQEGKGSNAAVRNLTPTYAAVTARSHFPGAVNVSMMDGSVRAVADEVNLGVWRAISTRNGSEILPDSFNKN